MRSRIQQFDEKLRKYCSVHNIELITLDYFDNYTPSLIELIANDKKDIIGLKQIVLEYFGKKVLCGLDFFIWSVRIKNFEQIDKIKSKYIIICELAYGKNDDNTLLKEMEVSHTLLV